jgi:hypothetical protein
MTTRIRETTFAELTETVLVEAASDALQFVEEFHEPLDPTATDWDGQAFGATCDQYHLRSFPRCDDLWPIYQAALVAETRRLCGL